MSLTPNEQRIHQLGRENATVHKALELTRYHDVSYTEALELAVIELAAQVAHSQEALTQSAMRAPAPIFIVKD